MSLCPTCGWHACVADTIEVECPLCQTTFTAQSHEDIGSLAWEILHHKTDPDQEWLDNWRDTIVPQYGCMCVDFFNAYITHTPPTFDENWFKWTVDLHNAVNVKLGKKTMTLEDARNEWQV